MPAETTVEVSRLSKSYSVRRRTNTGAFGLRKATRTVEALKNVNLVARRGESIGVLGRNGSGKSTLFRLMAGIEKPDTGSVKAISKPALLGINAAMIPSLSGRTNVELGCYAAGLSPQRTREALPGIAEFASIGDFFDAPMETYSSGMSARLRFAIAAASRPEILLVDEALAVGDATFKKKSADLVGNLLESAGTVFLVSHSTAEVENICNRSIWIEKGRIVADGTPTKVCGAYREWAWYLAINDLASASSVVKSIAQTDGDDDQ